MSIFNLDDDRIVRILHRNGIKCSLNKAFKVANIIYGAHLERLNEVEINSFDMGKKVGRSEAEQDNQDAVELAFSRGKMSAERASINMVIEATLWADLRFNSDNLRTKIRCIKKLREAFPKLSIRDGKLIVDLCSGEGYGITL